MKFISKIVVFSLLFGTHFSVFSLENDTQQPINIESNTQSFDMEKNIITLEGNVLITQGSIKIDADKVIILRKENQKEIVTAYGKPVTFHQDLDDGKSVDGQGDKVIYDVASEFLTLIENAKLEQLDSSVSAAKITYDVKKQQLKAIQNSKKSRVKTILIPNQLNNKK